MTTREDRLDALLNALNRPQPAPPGHAELDSSLAGLAAPLPDDRDLAPLLAAARDLAQPARARPDPVFAARLRERILAHADTLRKHVAANQPAVELTQRVTAPVAFPGPADGADPSATCEPTSAGHSENNHGENNRARGGQVPTIRAMPQRTASRRGILRAALIAAAILVMLGSASTATLAASAAPGTPLFGLRQFEQHVGETFMDAQSRAQAHLQAARQWLDDLRAAASGQPGSGAYSATLSALLSEDAAATQAIQQVPPGTTRDALSADLDALHSDERAALLAALPQIGWPDRIATTLALGPLGAAVPTIAGATVTTGHGLWQVTLTGSGFELGAVLLIDGRPLGSVLSITSTTLTAQAPSGLLKNGSVTLGIGNPDGTAAATTAIQQMAAPTATPNNHGNHEHGTPQATPTTTPGS